MAATIVRHGAATGIAALDEARRAAHAIARRYLRRARVLIFEVAERAYAKFEDRWLAGKRDITTAWLFVVIRRDVGALRRERLRSVDLDEREFEINERAPWDDEASDEPLSAIRRERLLAIREELEVELEPDYARLLACILGGGSMSGAARECGITLNKAKSWMRWIERKAKKILRKSAGLPSRE